MLRLNFEERIARRKLGASDEWQMFAWEMLNENDCLITGGVPVGEYRSGPRKGRPKWKKPGERAVVTRQEADAERLAWERETGNCSGCCGTKETWAGWSKDHGNKYRPCRRCNATGQSPLLTPNEQMIRRKLRRLDRWAQPRAASGRSAP